MKFMIEQERYEDLLNMEARIDVLVMMVQREKLTVCQILRILGYEYIAERIEKEIGEGSSIWKSKL